MNDEYLTVCSCVCICTVVGYTVVDPTRIYCSLCTVDSLTRTIVRYNWCLLTIAVLLNNAAISTFHGIVQTVNSHLWTVAHVFFHYLPLTFLFSYQFSYQYQITGDGSTRLWTSCLNVLYSSVRAGAELVHVQRPDRSSSCHQRTQL